MDGQTRPYSDNHEHVRDELRRLDLRIRLCASTMPLINGIDPAGQVDRTAYISPEEVAWLLEDRSADGGGDGEVAAIRRKLAEQSTAIDGRVAASRRAGTPLALPRISELFGLSEFETQSLVICLAPELRVKYDRLYAYLQDDITRKRPSVDLILALLCDTEDMRWTMQRTFSGAATLLRWQLVQELPDPHSPSGSSSLARFLRLDPRILRYLMGDDEMDAELGRAARLHHPRGDRYFVDDTVAGLLDGVLEVARTAAPCQPCYLQGPAESGKTELALRVCHNRGRAVVVADIAELSARPADEAAALMRAVCREATLKGGIVYFEHADALLSEPFGAVARTLRQLAAEHTGPLLLGGEQPWTATHVFVDAQLQTVAVPAPDTGLRASMWRHHLRAHGPEIADRADDLAVRFTLGESRIRQAILGAHQHRARRSADAPLTMADLTAACRDQADRQLGGLAVKVEPHYRWPDLVLPAARIEQLREICDQVTHHRLVYETWGFGRKLGHGRGLSVLFSGPPGTGKTMAAQVIAAEVGLRLFKVDLSGVVSKYIGETEKNLARIFAEAQSANAILFFDEADALFGKRTEVSDAHDRYANIETSYLLQKLDEHEGLVLLASNLRANLDDAFTRRIRCVVDFPFPGAEYRQRIWEAHFPGQTPLSDDIDFEALARDYELAGGSIKNIALNAAFLAAANGHRVGMSHIVSGTRREFAKLGKLWSQPALPSGMKS